MKNAVRYLFVLALALSVSFTEAQTIGKESLVLKKNIFIGFKGGIAAMDMQYKRGNGQGFVNHCALYQDFPGNLKSCWIGSVFVERTLPGWSYGLEFNYHATNALCSDEKPQFALQDSAYFANIRIPVKLKFLEDYLFSPYVFMAPEIGTYVSDSVAGLSYTVINGERMLWGKNNARELNVNVIAGAGVEAKIQIGLYEARVRLEGGYRLGLLSTTPKDYLFKRKTRGWEATIGFVFPLFLNPSYTWLN